MRWSRFALLILCATVLQAGLLENFDIKPDLLLILLVFFAVYSNTSEAVITSFTTGFAADIIAPQMMGPQIISFGLFGTLLAYLHRSIAVRKMPYQALLIFVIACLTGIMAHLLIRLKVKPTALNLYTFLGTSLCSAVVGPFLFLPSAWWMRIKTERFRRR